MLKTERSRVIALVLSLLIGGVFLDFFLVAVCRVGKAAIWGTTYVGIACVVGTKLLETPKWERWTRFGVIAFLVGCFGGHFAMSDHHSTREYPMTLSSPLDSTPMVFRSPLFPQQLLVVSEKLRAELAKRSDPERAQPVTVTVLATIDYGCFASFVIDQVGGVDVRLDSDASWVWKLDKNAPGDPMAEPGLEDQRIPWCPRKNP